MIHIWKNKLEKNRKIKIIYHLKDILEHLLAIRAEKSQEILIYNSKNFSWNNKITFKTKIIMIKISLFYKIINSLLIIQVINGIKEVKVFTNKIDH